jgi:hypothetical protein
MIISLMYTDLAHFHDTLFGTVFTILVLDFLFSRPKHH